MRHRAEARVRPSDAVALILAVALGTAFNLFTIAVLWDALFASDPGLSTNASQVLQNWGAGVLAILGTAVGYRAGDSAAARSAVAEEAAAPAPAPPPADAAPLTTATRPG